MKPSLFYKIASGFLAFFALAHTFGVFTDDEGAVKTVVTAMRTVHFDVMGSDRSKMDFYMGFGLLQSVFLLYSAVLSWQLSGIVKGSPRLARTIAWPFAACHVAVAILSWTNFFIAPQIVSSLAASCLLFAALQSGKQNPADKSIQ